MSSEVEKAYDSQAQPKVLCDSTFETNGAAFRCCLQKGHKGAHQAEWRGTEIACAWQAQPKEGEPTR